MEPSSSRGRGDPKFEAYMAELETHVSSRRLYALNWLFLGDPREGRTWADAVLQNLMFLPHNPMSSSMPARVTSEAVGGCAWKLQIQTTGILGVTLHYINRLPSFEAMEQAHDGLNERTTMAFPLFPRMTRARTSVNYWSLERSQPSLSRRDLRRELPRAQLCPTATQKNRSRLAVGIDLSDMECDESGQRRIFVHSRTHAAPTVCL